MPQQEAEERMQPQEGLRDKRTGSQIINARRSAKPTSHLRQAQIKQVADRIRETTEGARQTGKISRAAMDNRLMHSAPKQPERFSVQPCTLRGKKKSNKKHHQPSRNAQQITTPFLGFPPTSRLNSVGQLEEISTKTA